MFCYNLCLHCATGLFGNILVSTMQPWKVKKRSGGVKRKALKEYKSIIKSSQNFLIEEKMDDKRRIACGGETVFRKSKS